MNELKELAEQAQRLDEEPWYQLADLKEGFNVQPDDFAFVAAASPGTVSRLIAQIEALQYLLKQAEDEMGEQARLLGMSGSREAALLAERDTLKSALSEYDALIRYQYTGSHEAMHALTKAAKAGASLLGKYKAMAQRAPQ